VVVATDANYQPRIDAIAAAITPRTARGRDDLAEQSDRRGLSRIDAARDQ
jgi:hypothetical protein